MSEDTAQTQHEPDSQEVRDLEIKDATLIFNSLWAHLEEEFEEENLRFPREIFWLNGAPGSGKGTHTKFMLEFRDISAEPVVVSSLLKSPEAKKMIDAGMLVGDREVTDLVFRRLLKPEYKTGAVVDGYPRSLVQVECLKLLYRKLMELRAKYLNTMHAQHFPRPNFHIVVLFVDEATSVERQLERGRKMEEYNREVEASGVGEKVKIRKTDLDRDKARNRYQVFKEQTYASLKSLREIFHYHFINAQGQISSVQRRIVDELRYQSSLELDQRTYDRLTGIPIATTISESARQALVNRLDNYEQHHTDLFSRVVNLIEEYFMPIVRRHALSGRAYINSEDTTFNDPMALAMLIDIFSERGYGVAVDIRKEEVPHRIDPSTYEIHTKTKRIYRVSVTFKGSDIRRGG